MAQVRTIPCEERATWGRDCNCHVIIILITIIIIIIIAVIIIIIIINSITYQIVHVGVHACSRDMLPHLDTGFTLSMFTCGWQQSCWSNVVLEIMYSY